MAVIGQERMFAALPYRKKFSMRILLVSTVAVLQILILCAVLWYGYFGLYWIVGRLSTPSLGLALISAPLCMLAAFALTFRLFLFGLSWTIDFAERLHLLKNEDSDV
ncbi:hypothetical protein [Acidovorax sp. ACV01]|uniref:hypothetical protein n=1 Tax=Acidovorax sp. ACV01 TaxID=2769311 RepID=UPI00177C7857|nr:hypothetical protein [Acidovorax sp. ACV01]MBD9391456.1 hypothetical protein [Acidovorax sp. ACV01]